MLELNWPLYGKSRAFLPKKVKMMNQKKIDRSRWKVGEIDIIKLRYHWENGGILFHEETESFVHLIACVCTCVNVLQKYSFVCPLQDHLPSVPENVCSGAIQTLNEWFVLPKLCQTWNKTVVEFMPQLEQRLTLFVITLLNLNTSKNQAGLTQNCW